MNENFTSQKGGERLSHYIESGKPTLLVFYATWCPHCRNMEHTLGDLAVLLADSLSIKRIDIDRDGKAAKEAAVKSVPTYMVFDAHGRRKWRYTGELHADALLGKIEAAIMNSIS